MRVGFMISVLVFAGLTWQYIDHLDIKKRGKDIIVYRAVMEDLVYEKNSAVSQLNHIREAIGMNTLVPEQKLEQAAQHHADYLVENHEKTHFEVKGKKKFTGVAPVDRIMYVKRESRQVSENLSTSHNSGKASIEGLFSAIYHRFAFLDPRIDTVGVGVAQEVTDSSNSAFVYLMGNSMLDDLCREANFNGAGRYVYQVCRKKKHRIEAKTYDRAKTYHQEHNPEIMLYPYDGEREVPPAFYDEDPDPLPDLEVSGFPVSVMFNPYYIKKVDLEYFKLYKEGDSKEVQTRLMDQVSDPHGRFTVYQFALFPLQRLDYNSQYRVELSYRVVEKNYTKVWHFHTLNLSEELYVIDQIQQTIHLREGRSSILYFKPLDASDLLKNIRYPKDISLVFLDGNTIRLSFLSGEKKDFVIKTDRREVQVKVDRL